MPEIKFRLCIFIGLIIWVPRFIKLVPMAIKWGKERYERAKVHSPIGIVEDRIPEAYYS